MFNRRSVDVTHDLLCNSKQKKLENVKNQPINTLEDEL